MGADPPCLRTIPSQHAIDRNNLGRNLCNLVGPGIVGGLCGRDQHAEDDCGHGRDQASHKPCDFFFTRSKIILRNSSPDNHANEA